MRLTLNILRAGLIIGAVFISVIYYTHSPRTTLELLHYLQYEANILLAFLVVGILRTFTKGGDKV